MFRFDPDSSYTMPAHFGPRQIEPGASGWYRDVTAMTVQYLTDPDRLAAHLPEPFEVGDEPIVTVFYAQNRQVDWLAGHGYNMIGVTASAVYRGESEKLTGTFTLVVWENLADPILTGRELQGIPKIYADIADHTVDAEDSWHAGAEHFGHGIVDLSIGGLQPLDTSVVEAAQREQAGSDHPMGWRHFTNVGRPGAAIDEPTTFPSENVIDEAWVGEGAVGWHRLTWEQNPTQYRIVNALADLPIVEYRPAVVTKGSTNLVLLDRLPRVLR
jgi:hypothetical protein